MSLLWNPHAFTPLGEPVTPTASPALRVIEGEATADQLAAAQKVFYKFCMHTRLSAAPNPTEIGRLPDGSRYRITDVAGVRTMELWFEDDRRSGIGLSLTTLSGELVPNHIHKDGIKPQPYILTSGTRSGTRESNGRWKKRKVDSYVGGKAVWADINGNRLITGGIGVAADVDLLGRFDTHEVLGTNNRIYYSDGVSPGQNFYTDGERPIGCFRSEIDTIPFFRKRANGELWLMQLTPNFDIPASIRLYGEIYTGGHEIKTVGELLHEFLIPSGRTMTWQTLSVSPDGTVARIVFTKNDLSQERVEIEISEDRLSIATTASQIAYKEGSDTTTTSGRQNYPGVFTWLKIMKPSIMPLACGYSYGPRGEKTETDVIGTRFDHALDGYEKITENYSFDGPGVFVGGWDIETKETINEYDAAESAYVACNEFRINMPSSPRKTNSYSKVVDHRWVVDGSIRRELTREWQGSDHMSTEYKSLLFFEPNIGLSISSYQGYINSSYSGGTSFKPWDGEEIINANNSAKSIYRQKIEITHKGVVILSDETNTELTEGSGINVREHVEFVASAAYDPYTGAVCVNVLEIDTRIGFQNVPLRSWIVLADDVGAKFLHEVMDLPDGTNIRIKQDSVLLSVV